MTQPSTPSAALPPTPGDADATLPTPPTTTRPTSARITDLLGLGTGNTAVVGLQWGDEGKGQLVDALAGEFDATVRYNGGNNAGHSVHVGDEKLALHLLPSGILYEDKLSVIGNGVVLDPSDQTGILKELAMLADRGIVVGPGRLRISSRAHVVMPYHKVQDRLFDHALAVLTESVPIGTTGRGIGPCYADKALRSTAIRVGDLIDPPKLRSLVGKAVGVKNAVLAAMAEQCGEAFEPFNVEAVYREALAQGEALAPYICDSRELLQGLLNEGKRLLFEGANAVLLDVDHGTYPFVTSSSTSALGVPVGTGLAPREVHHILGVAKLYTSRVGGGPHPTQLDDAVGEHIRNTGREFGTTTGRPRRVGWLDLSAVRYSAQLNGCTALCCTGLSVLSGLAELRLCVGYEIDGERLAGFPPDADLLARATPIYETMPGFEGELGGIRDFAELPDAAKAYIDRVEAFVQTPVRLVCVGPKRSQMLVRG